MLLGEETMGVINLRAEKREISEYLATQLGMANESDRETLITALKRDSNSWINYLNNARKAKRVN